MKLLFVSNPIGPLGSGSGGGVELTMQNAALALSRRNHKITVVAPVGSRLAHADVIEVPGDPPPAAQHQDRMAPVLIATNSVLANMWEVARAIQPAHCLAVNFAYDWLPFYVTPFLQIPVAHLVSMGSLLDNMDAIIDRTIISFPGSVAMHTNAQARTFNLSAAPRIIGNGLEIELYAFNPRAEERLCWIGRVAREKGLEDAAAAAEQTRLPLDVMGIIEDSSYWNEVRGRFPNARIAYRGFLETSAMVEILRRAKALLMTPKWTEAFGNVVMEALACGVPVISYRRGGPSEMIEHGRSGLLVDPDDVDGLIDAITHVAEIDRAACRSAAEREFSLEALGARYEHWFAGLVTRAGLPFAVADYVAPVNTSDRRA